MKKFFIIFIFIFLVSCSTPSVTYTALSTKELKLKNADLTKFPQNQVKVKICDYRMPQGFYTPTLDQLVKKALMEGQGDLMINATYEGYGKWYEPIKIFLLFPISLALPVKNCGELEGTVINTNGEKK